MDAIILLSKSLVMGVVEGVTEFLPISSTGHLILVGAWLDFPDRSNRDVYEIFIQLGAVLALIWEYRAKLIKTVRGASKPGPARRLTLGILLAFLPAALLGLLLGDSIKTHLFAPVPVALAFIVGGGIILLAETRRQHIRVACIDAIPVRDAFLIGIIQCLALIPGTSRSGAAIIGGLFLGLSRAASTEFSFFLGIPTLGAASLYSLYQVRSHLNFDDIGLFLVGLVAAFISALSVIRALMRFVSNHSSRYLPGIGLHSLCWYCSRTAVGLSSGLPDLRMPVMNSAPFAAIVIDGRVKTRYSYR